MSGFLFVPNRLCYNKSMGFFYTATSKGGHKRFLIHKKAVLHGFTIVEVMIFLAISALLFVSLISSTGSGISHRRYDDTVSDFVEFLRSAYAEVENTQNTNAGGGAERVLGCTLSSSDSEEIYQDANASAGAGRTNCAIYGKVLVFGLDGIDRAIYAYDLIGDIVDNTHKLSESNLPLLDALKEVHAEFLTIEKSGNTICRVNYAGNTDGYSLQWGGQIENTGTTHQPFRGMVVIVRSPTNGTIHTYTVDLGSKYVDLQRIFNRTFHCNDSDINYAISEIKRDDINASIYQLIEQGMLKKEDLDFCVYSEDVYAGRRNVRLHASAADGANASAVELVEADSEDNRCR